MARSVLATCPSCLYISRYPLEDVPPGWKPDPHRVWDKYNKENEPAAPVPIPGNKGNLTVKQVSVPLTSPPLRRLRKLIVPYDVERSGIGRDATPF